MGGGGPYPGPQFPPSHVPQHHQMRMPYPPAEDLMYTARSQQSDTYRQMYTGMTPRPYPESKPVDVRPNVSDPSMYKSWPSDLSPPHYFNGFMANNISRSPDMRYMSPHMSHPLEGQHFSPQGPRMSDHFYMPPPMPPPAEGQFMPFPVPRPPDVPIVHSSGDTGKHFQRRQPSPQTPVMSGPEAGGTFPSYPPPRHGGIPYPPPPVNVDLASYFSFLAAQGFPVPYPIPYPVQGQGQPQGEPAQRTDSPKEEGHDGKELSDLINLFQSMFSYQLQFSVSFIILRMI